MQNYEIKECLHKTGGIEVLRVTEKGTGTEFIIKKIKFSQMKEEEKVETVKEVQALQKLDHEHIVRYIWSFKDEAARTINIVMSYCPGGDLFDMIEKKREVKASFPTTSIVKVLYQLCKALAYIHSLHILHRDIKPRNIFVAHEQSIKLGDFGIAKLLDSTFQYSETHNIGTFPYTAPEIFSKDSYRQKCDIWSLGCVLYEMMTLEMPFQAKGFQELINQITNDPYPPLPGHVDRHLADLIAELLHKDPRERPDAKQILERPFVASAEFDGISAFNLTVTLDIQQDPDLQPQTPGPPFGGDGMVTEEHMVPDEMVGLIIGRGGERIKGLQAQTGCNVMIAADSGGMPERSFMLTGTPQSITLCKHAIQQIINQVPSPQ